MIGAIILDKSDKDWNYVVLGPDEQGRFRWIEGNTCFKDRDLALKELLGAMNRIAASGEEVFSQD